MLASATLIDAGGLPRGMTTLDGQVYYALDNGPDGRCNFVDLVRLDPVTRKRASIRREDGTKFGTLPYTLTAAPGRLIISEEIRAPSATSVGRYAISSLVAGQTVARPLFAAPLDAAPAGYASVGARTYFSAHANGTTDLYAYDANRTDDYSGFDARRLSANAHVNAFAVWGKRLALSVYNSDAGRTAITRSIRNRKPCRGSMPGCPAAAFTSPTSGPSARRSRSPLSARGPQPRPTSVASIRSPAPPSDGRPTRSSRARTRRTSSATSAERQSFASVGGTVYFSRTFVDSGFASIAGPVVERGTEVWQTDGTVGGTMRVSSAFAGPFSVRGKLLFTPAATSSAIAQPVTDVGGIAGQVVREEASVGSFASNTAGFTVYLDANNNKRLDAGERSAVTDARGRFAFQSLAIKPYTVRLADAQGFTATRGTSARVTPTVGQQTTVEFVLRDDVRESVCGVALAPPTWDIDGQSRELAERSIWLDLDRDGKRDPGERSVRTGWYGEFDFGPGLAAGIYPVRVIGRDELIGDLWIPVDGTSTARLSFLVNG